MASQSPFLTKFRSGCRFLSFLAAAAMNCTPSSRCNFRRNGAVFSSNSVVFVVFSILATSPSVIIQRLASNCVVIVIVGGSTLCAFSSCMQVLESTRLTQISLVSFFSRLSESVCVAIVEVGVSVWAARVGSKLISFCFLSFVVLVEVASSKMIFGKFVFVSCLFFDEGSSLTS